jgi:hypothetical protein
MDADDNRSAHLKTAIRDRNTLLKAGGLAAAFFGGIWLFSGSPILAAAIALAAFGFLIWAEASSKAAEDFYKAYASSRNLERVKDYSLPPLTDLLRKGDRRYTGETFRGHLPGGLDGTLAHYTYVEVTHDSKGRRQESHHPFTLAVFELPSAHPVPSISLARNSIFGGLIDALSSKDRVDLESQDFNKKFDLYLEKNHDANWLRQLFSPKFIVDLCDSPLTGLGFEIEDRTLIIFDKGRKDGADELDRHATASCEVARHILTEVAEGVPVEAAPPKA